MEKESAVSASFEHRFPTYSSYETGPHAGPASLWLFTGRYIGIEKAGENSGLVHAKM
jgi:hypothetical protein